MLATMTHSIPASTSAGMALSVNTISAGNSPKVEQTRKVIYFDWSITETDRDL